MAQLSALELPFLLLGAWALVALVNEFIEGFTTVGQPLGLGFLFQHHRLLLAYQEIALGSNGIGASLEVAVGRVHEIVRPVATAGAVRIQAPVGGRIKTARAGRPVE